MEEGFMRGRKRRQRLRSRWVRSLSEIPFRSCKVSYLRRFVRRLVSLPVFLHPLRPFRLLLFFAHPFRAFISLIASCDTVCALLDAINACLCTCKICCRERKRKRRAKFKQHTKWETCNFIFSFTRIVHQERIWAKSLPMHIGQHILIGSR